MKKQKILVVVILLLMINLFLEITVGNNELPVGVSKRTSVSELNDNHHQADQRQEHTAHEHCSSGVCHSGFCKILNAFASSAPHFPFYFEQYSSIQFTIPDSPFLTSNRRPPKSPI